MARSMGSDRDIEQKSARGRGRPRQEDAPDPTTVERIALLAFASEGFDGARLRSIANMANVDPALVSRRYGSKEGLWKATVDQLADRMSSLWTSLNQLQHGKTPFRERFEQALRLFVSFCCEVPELGRFFTDEIAKPGARRDYLLDRIWRPHVAAMQPLLKEACQVGLLPSEDDQFLTYSLVGMVAMPLMMASAIKTELGLDDNALKRSLHRSVSILLPQA